MTDTSRDTVETLALIHKATGGDVAAEVMMALLVRAEQAEARERALRDTTAELRELRRAHNAMVANTTGILAAQNNVIDGLMGEMHRQYRAERECREAHDMSRPGDVIHET